MKHERSQWEEKLSASHYALTDIYLASSLIAAGFPMTDLFKKENQFTFYLVVDTGKGYTIYDEIESYWRGTLNVSAKSLWNAYKEIKYRMNIKRGEEK